MEKDKKHPAGETILEVLIAVTTILAVIAPAAALYAGSVQSSAENRAELVALSLSEEGVEMVRNVIDTNLLKFPANPECWNALPEVTDASQCSGINLMSTGNFSGAFDPTVDPLSILFVRRIFVFNFSLFSNLSNESYRLKLDAPNTFLYNHTRGISTDFFRELQFTLVNMDNNTRTNEGLRVVSNVYYRTGRDLGLIRREAIFSNPSL